MSNPPLHCLCEGDIVVVPVVSVKDFVATPSGGVDRRGWRRTRARTNKGGASLRPGGRRVRVAVDTTLPWTTPQALALSPLRPRSRPRATRSAGHSPASAHRSPWSATGSCSWGSSGRPPPSQRRSRRPRTSSSNRPWPTEHSRRRGSRCLAPDSPVWCERSGAGGGEGFGLGRVDADRLVEAGEGQDLAVVFAQAHGHEPLALALHPDEQGHEKADATTVHVYEVAEVEDDDPRAVRARADVRVDELALAGGRDVAPDRDPGGPGREPPDLDRRRSGRHRLPSVAFAGSSRIRT